MTIETISNKIDNLDYTLRELARAVSQSNQSTFISVVSVLIVFAIAIIISQAVYIKIIKKMQKQLIQQNTEIEKLKGQISKEEISQ